MSGPMKPVVALALAAAAVVGPLGQALGFTVATPAPRGAAALRGAVGEVQRLETAREGMSSASFAAASLALAATAAAATRRSNRANVARQALLVGEATPALPFAGGTVVALSKGLGCATPTTTLQGADERSVSMNLLMPKNIKWKKPHKPAIKPFRHSTKWKYKGKAVSGNKPHFGKFALQATEEAWVSAKQIESVRRALVRTMERKGKIWIRVFPHQAITKRVAESRMGAGKGGIEKWVQAVRPGFILFELDGVDELCAKTAFRKAGFRLPCKCKMLIKDTPSMWELGLAGKEKRVGAAGMDPRAAIAKKGKK